MSFEDTIAALLDARLAPLRQDLERLAHEIAALKQAMPPMFVRENEAARRTGLSLATVKRRVKSGEWPSRLDGRTRLVDLSALRPMSDEEVARTARKLRAVGGGHGPG